MKQKKVMIRVDANEHIATGHIMRCLSIAEQLKMMNISCVFVVADDTSKELLDDRGYRVDVLGSRWNDLHTEMDTMIKYINFNAVDVLLLDTYYVTKEYLQNISRYTRIIYIDDLCRFDYPVHTIINYNLYDDSSIYNEIYSNGDCPKLLIGAKYIPLRTEFAFIPYQVKTRVDEVLITTGGTDQYNLSYAILKKAVGQAEINDLKYHVIVGKYNQHIAELKNIEQKYSNIYLHENVSNISEWMRKCDVAVSAGGTTLYELCACGTPTVCMEIADNQEGADWWQKNDYMFYAGNANMDIEACIDNCVEGIRKYVNDYDLRVRRSKRAQELIDGKGSYNISRYIDELLEN